jgi:hypothetical protein
LSKYSHFCISDLGYLYLRYCDPNHKYVTTFTLQVFNKQKKIETWAYFRLSIGFLQGYNHNSHKLDIRNQFLRLERGGRDHLLVHVQHLANITNKFEA